MGPEVQPDFVDTVYLSQDMNKMLIWGLLWNVGLERVTKWFDNKKNLLPNAFMQQKMLFKFRSIVF